MRKFYTLLAFILFTSSLHAQLTLGPKIGGNLSRLMWSEGENNEKEPDYQYKQDGKLEV